MLSPTTGAKPQPPAPVVGLFEANHGACCVYCISKTTSVQRYDVSSFGASAINRNKGFICMTMAAVTVMFQRDRAPQGAILVHHWITVYWILMVAPVARAHGVFGSPTRVLWSANKRTSGKRVALTRRPKKHLIKRVETSRTFFRTSAKAENVPQLSVPPPAGNTPNKTPCRAARNTPSNACCAKQQWISTRKLRQGNSHVKTYW